MADYTYSIQNDFPNQAVDLSVLTAEILAAGGSPVLEGINVNGDDVVISFDTALSGPEETALNNIIANHQGQPFTTGIQSVNSEAEQTETGTTYVEAASLTSGILKAGDYLVTWYCEISCASLLTTSAVFAQVVWNGTERAFDSTSQDQYTSFSGSVVVSVNDLDTPTMALNFRRAGLANTARVRRIRMSLTPIMNGESEEE